MSDWIKARAEEIRRVEKERKTERDRLADAASILKTKIEPFWNELVGVLQQSVNDFNVEFPEPERRIDHFGRQSSTVVTIGRSAFPAATLNAQLNGVGTGVHFSISRTLKKGAEAVEKHGSFAFGLVDGQVGYIEGGVTSHEDVAKLFIEPFFSF